MHYNTLKVRKIYNYTESRKFVKTRIVHHLLLLLLLLLLSNSVQTAYRETGVSNRSNSFTKIIYTGAYMILDAQKLHTFSQSRQTPGLQPYKCYCFRRHFLVCSRAEHVKLVLCPTDAGFVSVELPLFRALCCLFGYVNVAPFLYCCRQLDPLLYSVGNIRTRHVVGVTDNC